MLGLISAGRGWCWVGPPVLQFLVSQCVVSSSGLEQARAGLIRKQMVGRICLGARSMTANEFSAAPSALLNLPDEQVWVLLVGWEVCWGWWGN